MSGSRRGLTGIFTPTITIFKDTPDQEIDIEANQKHILYLAQSGIHGALIQGSTGEQVALTREERIQVRIFQWILHSNSNSISPSRSTHQLTKSTREILDKNGFDNFTIMAGAGGQSVQESVTLSKDAAAAGADYAVVLPPSFFAPSMTADSLEEFYREVADKSPIPILIYSWPGASSGLEVTSDGVKRLAKHTNIVGIKQTDHNVGKMARNVYQNPGFYVLAGASDYLIGGLAVGIQGSITGITNFFPRTLLYLYNLFKEGKYDEAKQLQGQVSAAEWAILANGIPSAKYATQLFRGYGGIPRRPLPPPPLAAQQQVKKLMSGVAQLEQSLAAKAKA